MGATVTRARRNREYVYYVYYDANGDRKEKYCGAKGVRETDRRALELEANETEMLIANLTTRLSKLKVQIAEVSKTPVR